MIGSKLVFSGMIIHSYFQMSLNLFWYYFFYTLQYQLPEHAANSKPCVLKARGKELAFWQKTHFFHRGGDFFEQ